MTKLGRLVKARIINTIEEIYLHSIPIKEYQIVDLLLPGKRSLSPFALCFFLKWGACLVLIGCVVFFGVTLPAYLEVLGPGCSGSYFLLRSSPTCLGGGVGHDGLCEVATVLELILLLLRGCCVQA